MCLQLGPGQKTELLYQAFERENSVLGACQEFHICNTSKNTETDYFGVTQPR